jgi:hypothetical protein
LVEQPLVPEVMPKVALPEVPLVVDARKWAGATLTFEQHVAPTAIRTAWRLSHGVEGNSGEESTQKNPFHSFVLF